jgi:hypothetical protein
VFFATFYWELFQCRLHYRENITTFHERRHNVDTCERFLSFYDR